MPSTELRQTVLTAARRVVVKLGTQVLTSKSGHLDVRYIGRVARQVAELRRRGLSVTMVTSGAIGAGLAYLGLNRRPHDVADLQAVAALGQPKLMMHMSQALGRHDLKAAQLLLTRADFEDRTRFLNIRNCVTQIHAHGCIPIINENDTVAVDELRFGDNDMLAALMTNAIRADALVLLTVVDGLLDQEGRKVDLVDHIGEAQALTRDEKSPLGSGGMRSKLDATRLVTEAGEIAVIANGRVTNVLPRLFAGERGIGTVFVPSQRKLDSRQRWIGLTKKPVGTITVDEGAARAVVQRGKSLLASGITQVQGKFRRGEVVTVRDQAGQEVARGMTNYTAEELEQIKGKRSDQFEKILGRGAFAAVIHRDNMVVMKAVGQDLS